MEDFESVNKVMSEAFILDVLHVYGEEMSESDSLAIPPSYRIAEPGAERVRLPRIAEPARRTDYADESLFTEMEFTQRR